MELAKGDIFDGRFRVDEVLARTPDRASYIVFDQERQRPMRLEILSSRIEDLEQFNQDAIALAGKVVHFPWTWGTEPTAWFLFPELDVSDDVVKLFASLITRQRILGRRRELEAQLPPIEPPVHLRGPSVCLSVARNDVVRDDERPVHRDAERREGSGCLVWTIVIGLAFGLGLGALLIWLFAR